MVNIRINDLPEDDTPNASDFVPIDAASTRKTTIADLVTIGRPLASQAEAEAGTEPSKAMTPLTTAQAIDAQRPAGSTGLALLLSGTAADARGVLGVGVTGEDVFLANTAADIRALLDLEPGTDVQAQSAILQSLADETLTAGDLLFAADATTIANLPIGAEGEVLAVTGGALGWTAAGTGDMTQAVYDPDDINDVVFARLPVMPEAFDATFNGSDDKTAIEAAAAFAVLNDRPLLLSPERTYSFSTLTLPAGLRVIGDGVLRALGGLTETTDVDLVIEDGVVLEELNLSHPGGTRSNFYIVEIADDVKIGSHTLTVDAQTNNSAIHMVGSRSEIEFFKSRLVDRPITIEGVSATTSANKVWNIDVESYVRGVLVKNSEKCLVGHHTMRVRSPNVPAGEVIPGHNGILMEGAPGLIVLDGVVEDAGEHAYRIGGSTVTRSNTLVFGNLTAIRPRGCAFKSNPLGKSNTPEDYAENVSIAYLVGIDVGDGQLGELGKQPNFCQVTSTRKFRLGGGKVIADGQTVSCLSAIALNDCDDIVIGPVDAPDTAAGLFVIREDQDVEVGDEGSVTNVRINGLTGSLNDPSANTAITIDTTQDISDIYLNGVEVSGYNVRLLIFNASASVTGRFHIQGKSFGSVAPLVTSAPTSDFCTIDWKHNEQTHYKGKLSLWRNNVGVFQLAATASASLSAGPTGLYLNSTALTAATNAYTMGLEFGRNGTSRIGAAIAGKHTSAADIDLMGLAFMVKNNTLGGSDLMVEGATLKHDGNLSLNLAGTGIEFTSPDGLVRRRLTIDNAGAAVWTTL